MYHICHCILFGAVTHSLCLLCWSLSLSANAFPMICWQITLRCCYAFKPAPPLAATPPLAWLSCCFSREVHRTKFSKFISKTNILHASLFSNNCHSFYACVCISMCVCVWVLLLVCVCVASVANQFKSFAVAVAVAGSFAKAKVKHQLLLSPFFSLLSSQFFTPFHMMPKKHKPSAASQHYAIQ